MERHLDLTLRNDLAEIPRLAEAVETFGAALGLPPTLLYPFNLAFDELITNTVSYGYADVAEHAIEVRLLWEGDRLSAEVIDDGRPFDPLTQAPEPDLDAPLEARRIGGLGVYLVKTLMDEVSYRRDGAYNHLRFAKRLTAAGATDDHPL